MELSKHQLSVLYDLCARERLQLRKLGRADGVNRIFELNALLDRITDEEARLRED